MKETAMYEPVGERIKGEDLKGKTLEVCEDGVLKVLEGEFPQVEDDIIDRKIEVLRSEQVAIADELRQIKDILRKNKLLVDYISEMKLIVKSSTGEEIPVTQENLIDFSDNNDMLVARREMLSAEINQVNRKIDTLTTKKKKEDEFPQAGDTIEDIKKVVVK